MLAAKARLRLNVWGTKRHETRTRELIDAYCDKAAELIPRLSKALGFKLPITNGEWVSLDIPGRGTTNDGLQYFKHGFGVAIKFDGGAIDLDFGDNGEYDGFDADRLFRFAIASHFPTLYKNHREVEADVKDAEAKSELRFSGYILYYRAKNDEPTFLN